MLRTRKGFLWTSEGGSHGLETDAVVPSSATVREEYDVVIIGAGFAGLTAARDLQQLYGLSVLITEGRDRIGGRTWTAKVDGEEFEMGGNWIHWFQPTVWNELVRYGLDREIRTTSGSMHPEKTYMMASPGKIELAKESGTLQQTAEAFFSIDGHTAHTLMPYPHDPHRAPSAWKEYEHLSIRDRLNQMTDVSEENRALLEHLIDFTTLASSDTCGFAHFLKWYALGGYSVHLLSEMYEGYKLGPGGLTRLAKCILGDFNGDRVFDTVVTDIKHDKKPGTMSVLCSGQAPGEIKAKVVVSTIPLNCLKKVNFSPDIPELHSHLMRQGHSNTGWKIHVSLSQAAAWSHACMPSVEGNPWIIALQDRNVAQESSYAIAFGYAGAMPNPTASTKDAQRVKELYEQAFSRPGSDAQVRALFTHDWASDPMSLGAWMASPPGLLSECLDTMRKPYADGRLVFANADWAEGGYSFIDGAIEQGKKAAQATAQRVSTRKKARSG